MSQTDTSRSTPTYLLRQALADYAHTAWSGWMRYLFSKSTLDTADQVVIPEALALRWSRQMRTPYADLPVEEQASDLKEADKMLALMELTLKAAKAEGMLEAARMCQAHGNPGLAYAIKQEAAKLVG